MRISRTPTFDLLLSDFDFSAVLGPLESNQPHKTCRVSGGHPTLPPRVEKLPREFFVVASSVERQRKNPNVGPATTQNLVVKFDGEIYGGVLVENASDNFPSKRSSKISCQTSPKVRHQFRRKLRRLHPGNRWCLQMVLTETLTTETFQLKYAAHKTTKSPTSKICMGAGGYSRANSLNLRPSKTSDDLTINGKFSLCLVGKR